jgi:hypothetical protein
MKQSELHICPKCASINLKNNYLVSPLESSKISSKRFVLGYETNSNPEIYLCLDCDYYGICPQIDKKLIKEFRRQIKTNKTKNIINKQEKSDIKISDNDWVSKNKWFKILFLFFIIGIFLSIFFNNLVLTIIFATGFAFCSIILSYHKIWKKRFG